MMHASPLIAHDLGRRYRRSRPWALRHVELDFPANSITALIGPNGAGKSTLIRACLGFERPDQGWIEVFGRDPAKERAAALGTIGYVPQSASLYRALSIADHITMARSARPSFDHRYALARVARAGLGPERRISELSGGEQAQVALALALGTRAPLLLLDEPLASLDPLSRREFLGIMIEDAESLGTTVVLSSHVVADVEHACDRVVVLAGGRLVLQTTIESALRRFRIVPARESDVVGAIGVFAGPDGSKQALLDRSDIGRRASLEEIVLGHLASARRPAGENDR